MKIYTQVIDIALQSPKRFWVAPYSDFKIGVKIVKNGTPIGNEFTVKKGTTTLTPDEDLVDGFKTYTIKSGSTGFEEYTVEISGVGETQKLTQIVTDSTVFDIDAAGMQSVSWNDIQDKPDVLTPSSSQITELESTVSALTQSFGELDSTVSALTSSLSSYATKIELSDYATTSAMESYVDSQIGAVLSMNF